MLDTSNLKVERAASALRSNMAATGKLNPLLSFIRATEGAYFDIDGVMKWAPANQPRIEYDPLTKECLGVKIEATAVNCLHNSRMNTIATAATSNAWYMTSGGTFTHTAHTVPWVDGAASKLMTINHTAVKELVYAHPTRNAFNAFLSFSIFVLPVNLQPITIQLLAGSTVMASATVSFNANKEGTITATQFINTRLGNHSEIQRINAQGWSRIHLMVVAANETRTDKVTIKIRFPAGQNQCCIHGAQLEDIPYMSSYIRTGATEVTRNTDNLHIPATAVSALGLMKDDEITVVTECMNRTIATSNHITAGASLYHNANWRCRTLVHSEAWGVLRIMFSGRLLGGAPTLNVYLSQNVDKASWAKSHIFRTGFTIGKGVAPVTAAMGVSSVNYVNNGSFSGNVPNIYFGSYEGGSNYQIATTADLGFNGYFRDIMIINKRVGAREMRALTDPISGQHDLAYLRLVGPLAE